MRHVSLIGSLAWLLPLSVFASIGLSQQGGQPQAGTQAPGELATQSSKSSRQLAGVIYRDGRLSVSIKNLPLARLVDDLSGKANLPIILSGDVGNQLVSANFQNLPLDAGLRMILMDFDAFFYFGTEGQELSSLKVVWVYPKGGGRGVQPVPADKWASTKELEGMLAAKNPEVRARAIQTLVERKGQGAMKELLKSLQDSNDQVRAGALFGAAKASLEVPEGVLTDLVVADPSADVRFLALQALANTPDAGPIAERALNDPNESVRVEARDILARLDEEANPSQQPQQSPENQQPQNQPPQQNW